MAQVNQRSWRIPGQRTKRKAWGFTVQLPCSPCPHRHPETGAVLHPDGVRQVRKYKAEWTRDDAENELAALKLGIEQPKPTETASGMTLTQAADRYLATKARKRSIAKDRLTLEHFKSAFGAETPLADLTASRISEYKAQRLAAVSMRRKGPDGEPATLSAASINRPLALLRHLLRLAHEEWEVLSAVPRIKLEKEPEGRIRWLEPDEESRLLAACARSRNPNLAKIVTVALETGLRKAELLGLTWDRVDLSRGVIRLELTKSGRRREVPMRQAVYDILAPLRARAEEALKPGPDGRPPELRGRVWPAGEIRTAFENAVTAAGLDDFHFHDTRHHFASWFVMRGGNLQALQKLLGHASLAMTQRYAHLSPDYLRNEVAKTERPTPARCAEPASPSAQASAQEPIEPVGVSRKS